MGTTPHHKIVIINPVLEPGDDDYHYPDNPGVVRCITSTLMWLSFFCAPIAAYSRGWGSAPYVWIPMLVIGGYGVWRTLRGIAVKYPGGFTRLFGALAFGLVIIFICHKAYQGVFHHERHHED